MNLFPRVRSLKFVMVNLQILETSLCAAFLFVINKLGLATTALKATLVIVLDTIQVQFSRHVALVDFALIDKDCCYLRVGKVLLRWSTQDPVISFTNNIDTFRRKNCPQLRTPLLPQVFYSKIKGSNIRCPEYGSLHDSFFLRICRVGQTT